MKNLKKVVALSLAAVMMFGMMVVGAGATTYKDTADSDYDVAIEVMSALNILSGDGTGNFNPDKTLIRGDAAYLAARVQLTPDNVGSLSAMVNTFSDVPAGKYYSGAVAWGVAEGYLSGYGDGTFKPTDSLLVWHFAKVLLNVLGYEDKNELTSETWSENLLTIQMNAVMAGLMKGLENVDWNAEITRGQASQMVYNALTANMVTYTGGTNFTVDGVTVTIGARRENVAQAKSALNWDEWDETEDSDEIMQLCEAIYPALKADKEGEDDLGRPGTEWFLSNKSIYVDVDEAVAEFNTNLTTDDGVKFITKALKGYNFVTEVGKEVELVIDGEASGTKIKTAAELAAITGNGLLVQVYANEKKEITNITLTNSYLGDVTKVTEATELTDRVITITGRNGGKWNVTTDAFEKGDAVIVYSAGGNAADAEAVKVFAAPTKVSPVEMNKTFVTGEINRGFYLTAEDKYLLHHGVASAVGDTWVGNACTLWFDLYGFVLDMERDIPEFPDDYAIVLKYALDSETFNDVDIAQLLLADGTIKNVTLHEQNPTNEKDGSGNVIYKGVGLLSDGTDGKDKWVGSIVTYAECTNPAHRGHGYYDIADAAIDFSNDNDDDGEVDAAVKQILIQTNEDNIQIDETDSTVVLKDENTNPVVFTGKTHFLLLDEDEEGESFYRTVTGFAAIDNILLKGAYDNYAGAIKGVTNEDGEAIFVYIDVRGNSYGEEAASGNWVYILSTATRVVSSTKHPIFKTYTWYEYDALVNGVETTYDDVTDALAVGDFFILNQDENTTIEKTHTGVEKVVNSVIGVNTASGNPTYYALAEDVQAYIVDSNDLDDIVEINVNKIESDKNDELIYVYVTNPKTKISVLTEIFVLKVTSADATFTAPQLSINGGAAANVTLTNTGNDYTGTADLLDGKDVELSFTTELAAKVKGTLKATYEQETVGTGGSVEFVFTVTSEDGTVTNEYTVTITDTTADN